MAASTASRVNKRRQALRKAGLRPVQLWVPDTRNPNFANECRRQAAAAAAADRLDTGLAEFMDGLFEDITSSNP